MNSIVTRCVCAMLSMVGTVGLVAASAPAVTLRGQGATAPVLVAAAPSSASLHG